MDYLAQLCDKAACQVCIKVKSDQLRLDSDFNHDEVIPLKLHAREKQITSFDIETNSTIKWLFIVNNQG